MSVGAGGMSAGQPPYCSCAMTTCRAPGHYSNKGQAPLCMPSLVSGCWMVFGCCMMMLPWQMNQRRPAGHQYARRLMLRLRDPSPALAARLCATSRYALLGWSGRHLQPCTNHSFPSFLHAPSQQSDPQQPCKAPMHDRSGQGLATSLVEALLSFTTAGVIGRHVTTLACGADPANTLLFNPRSSFTY